VVVSGSRVVIGGAIFLRARPAVNPILRSSQMVIARHSRTGANVVR